MGKIHIDFKTGNLKSTKEIIVGIDLGTTNSLAAYVENGHPKIMPIGKDSGGIIPSVLYFKKDHEVIVGDDAKQKMISDPEHSLYSVKRLIGKTFDDIKNKQQFVAYKLSENNTDELVKFQIDDDSFSAVELSAMILKEIKLQAEHYLGTEIHKAVITVPAYFTDTQRQSTRDAGLLAGLEVLRIINEPTAASMAYGIGLNPDEIKQVMVYDFGGGTFDVSILRIENGVFEVLATKGDNFLGGDDIDIAIADYWIKEQNIHPNREEYNEIRILAEASKKQLKENELASANFKNYTFSLSESTLRKIAFNLVEKTIACCKQAVKDSAVSIDDIDEIILVGGSTRLTLVKEKLTEAFNKPLNDSINPDEVVALGAAIQADILAGNRSDLLLLDIAPLSLGIETIGGLMDTIIPRNSKIPLQLAKNYTTSKDGQKNLKISIYQGERELVKDNIKLGEFILNDLPPMAAGLPKIEVKFHIDVDGILSVTAKELRSGKQQSIEVKSPYKLNEEEIARRLKESIVFAETDMKQRALIELINEANYILANADKFIKQNTEFLSEQEIELLESGIKEIELSLLSKEKEKIDKAIANFNLSTADVAHKIMDIQLQKSLGGSSIDNI
jgi:molecular chaperone HscA